MSSVRGPFSHRGTTANNNLGLVTPVLFNKTINNDSKDNTTNPPSEEMDLRGLDSNTSFIPVSAPLTGGRG